MADRSLGFGLLSVVAFSLSASAGPVTVTLGDPQTAGISGFRAMWDQPVVLAADGATEVRDPRGAEHGPTAAWAPSNRKGRSGAIAFDAIHRSLLVRFPDAAERIAAQIDKGFRLTKLEILLPFRHTEFEPPGDRNKPDPAGGYSYRLNWGVGALWVKKPARWHAVAWALRKPWAADEKLGPTYNAYVNGAGYWAKYGAADEDRDRFPRRFGPTEVSHKQAVGRVDVTAAVTDEAFGRTLAARLRRLADCGFLVRKWEMYDHRYYTGCYEWATGVGGRGIVIAGPKLAATFVADPKVSPVGTLPPAADVGQIARGGPTGKPTAVMPSREQIAAFAQRFGPRRPSGMPQWQWRRIEELMALGDGRNKLSADMPFWYQYVAPHVRNGLVRRGVPPTPERVYEAWVDSVLARQPRGWYGFEAAKVLLPWHLHRDAMPEPMKDHWRLYWTAWLMPDRTTSRDLFPKDPTTDKLIHPMYDQLKKGSDTRAKIEGDSYYAATGDWRGNKSFFRGGFCYTMSTMNFNHTASMGALLGGAIIGSPRAIADGRHGVEHWPLRTWSWLDGSTQESIDHYYFAITLSAQKMIADFGPTHFDRMLGRTILLKSADELASAYHPGLRRFISGSARTSVNHVLATQDGVYHIVHTLSKRGVLHGIPPEGEELPGGFPAVGREVPPMRVANQTLRAPWAPPWLAEVVDEKALPFEMTAGFTQWGGHREQPLQRRTYLGRHYGLYSTDNGWGFTPLMAQWRRADRPVEHMTERGTMFIRYGFNDTQMVNMGAGWIRHFGAEAALQHKGKLLLVTSPHSGALSGQKHVRSLQSTVALFNYERPRPTWRVHVDGKPAGTLPMEAKAGRPVAIHDGVCYLGIIPLPATDLGRDAEVVLRAGVPQEYDKKQYRPALLIDNHNLRLEKGVRNLFSGGDEKKVPDTFFDKAFWRKADLAYGGFVVEFGDESEYGSFEAFAKHMAAAKLSVRWEGDANTVHVRYRSGADVMEAGVRTDYRDGRTTDQLYAYRRVNGKWPYLPKGVWRQTPHAVQSSTGRLVKGGATLTCEPGRMAYLQALPKRRIYAGYNPFPDPTDWRLDVPGGVRIEAEGKLGLAHVVWHAAENRLVVDYALTAKQQADKSVAKSLLITGTKAPPTVTRNGRAPAARPAEIRHDGDQAWRVALVE